ncbi:MAG: hypothetical protein L3J53_06935 [Proteobacteria bacterium]|nr:hypothetical protein [Pseudomonadota bacterium]
MHKLNLFNHSNISKDTFLKEYWHKKPLLLQGAIDLNDLDILPTKTQLMQLSCNADIQSRVVFKTAENEYDVAIGPFTQQDLNNFDNYCWNLLISDVDKWQPQSRDILKYFSFIRNWLFDDIMISTGSVGGTVGPHTDHYDVFLIQVHGQRNWQYCHTKIYNPKLLPEQELKLMQNFKADKSLILKPGDVLYLPAETAHYGIATSDDCVTCSIGMRTPSHSEIVTAFVDNIAENISANTRFVEPEFSQQPNVGEITPDDLANIHKILTDSFDTNNLTAWFGKYITEYRSIFYEFNQQQNCDELSHNIDLTLSPFAKACYLRENINAKLFVNGECFNASIKLAQLVCDTQYLTDQEICKLDNNDRTIIKQLFANGSLLSA